MRRFLALARTAAIESLAEPLTAVLFLSGLATVHLAPVFHYHQFGEAGRLARECGFSALLVFGLIFATAAALHTIGRELESGTAAATLALAVPRSLFFVAKVSGVLAALSLFAVTVACATALSQGNSAIASLLQAEHGEGAQSWGPGLACGVGFTLGAFALAAAVNRFWRMRFCLSACLLLAAGQPVALLLAWTIGGGLPASFAGFGPLFARLLPPFAVLLVGCSVFVALAGALATRLKGAPATAIVAAAIVASFVRPIRFLLPDINHFWLVDRLAGGAALPWSEACPALCAGTLLIVLWLLAGALLLSRREIS